MRLRIRWSRLVARVHNPSTFKRRTKEAAKEVGRHPSAVVWEVIEGALNTSAHLGAPAPAAVGEEQVSGVRQPCKGAPAHGAPTAETDGCSQIPGAPEPSAAGGSLADLPLATPEQEDYIASAEAKGLLA